MVHHCQLRTASVSVYFGNDVFCRSDVPSGGPHRVCQQQLKSSLKEKFQHLFEGLGDATKASCLNEIYTELFITEGRPGAVNEEHEVRKIEAASWRAGRPKKTIRPEDIFNASPERNQKSDRSWT